MAEQMEMWGDNPEYEAFVDKFKPKKTTDDCYTPPEVYEAVKKWACEQYEIDPSKIVRPFWPGGDYESYDYPPDAVVLDNPPFSIITKICRFYLSRGIPFFLFAPSLTIFNIAAAGAKINCVVCDANITYENGAIVRTGFVTSYNAGVIAQTAPDLGKAIEDAQKEKKRKNGKEELPKYEYPMNVLTAAMLQRYSKYGVDWEIRRSECECVRRLDSQKESGKTIFGSGLLLSDRAAAERAAAERAAAHAWRLSDRERAIIERLGQQDS